LAQVQKWFRGRNGANWCNLVQIGVRLQFGGLGFAPICSPEALQVQFGANLRRGGREKIAFVYLDLP